MQIGIKTDQLNGQGFKRMVVEGQSVKRGDVIIEVNFAFIEERALSVVTPIVVSNMDMVQELVKMPEVTLFSTNRTVTGGENVVLIIKA